MALRVVVEGTVYMLAAREAVALARALRLRAMRRAVPDDALAVGIPARVLEGRGNLMKRKKDGGAVADAPVPADDEGL